MKKQDYLIGLIKSMDANEKRHFKLFANLQSGDKNYLRLFDTLDSKDAYRAGELSKELGISTAQLADAKRYLAQVIFKSLRSYKSEDAPFYFTNIMQDAMELGNRGLHEYSMEMVEKAIAKAKEEEAVFDLPKLLFLKMKSFLFAGQWEKIDNTFKDELVQANAAGLQYFDVYILLHQFVHFDNKRLKDQPFPLADYPAYHLQPEDIHTLMTRMEWYRMKFLIANSSGPSSDPEMALKLARDQRAFYESTPNALERWPYGYVASLQQAVASEMGVENLERALELNEQLWQLFQRPIKLRTDTIERFIFYADSNRIILNFFLGRYETALHWAGKMLTQNSKSMDFQDSFNYARIAMQLGKSAETIDFLDRFLQVHSDSRLDMQAIARPLMILAQMHLGNDQLVPYIIKSTTIWMKRNKISNPEVTLFLKQIARVIKVQGKKREEEWNELIKTIDDGKLDTMESMIHLRRWITHYGMGNKPSSQIANG